MFAVRNPIFVRLATSIAMTLALRGNKEVTCALGKCSELRPTSCAPFDAFVILFITVSEVMFGVLHGMWGREKET